MQGERNVLDLRIPVLIDTLINMIHKNVLILSERIKVILYENLPTVFYFCDMEKRFKLKDTKINIGLSIYLAQKTEISQL